MHLIAFEVDVILLKSALFILNSVTFCIFHKTFSPLKRPKQQKNAMQIHFLRFDSRITVNK